MSAGATGVEIRDNEVSGLGGASTEDADGIVCRGLTGLLHGACVVADNVVRNVAGGVGRPRDGQQSPGNGPARHLSPLDH